MTNVELIKKVAEETNQTQTATKALLETLYAIISDTVASGEDVKLGSIGTFKVVEVPERSRIISLGEHKGETQIIPAHMDVKMKLTPSFRNMVKDGE